MITKCKKCGVEYDSLKRKDHCPHNLKDDDTPSYNYTSSTTSQDSDFSITSGSISIDDSSSYTSGSDSGSMDFGGGDFGGGGSGGDY